MVQRELASAREFAQSNNGANVFEQLFEEELKTGVRIVAENNDFIAFVPYAARFPAEVWIYGRRQTRTLLDLTEAERRSLAEIISVIRKKYDNLYGFLMPLMMAVKQAPLRQPEAVYRFHVQFLPLQRSPTKLKYLATIETGYGTFLADTAPEQMADNLRRSKPATASYSGS
jgi:UDPglucose--hexose-1-phosphate uridylyltransferase